MAPPQGEVPDRETVLGPVCSRGLPPEQTSSFFSFSLQTLPLFTPLQKLNLDCCKVKSMHHNKLVVSNLSARWWWCQISDAVRILLQGHMIVSSSTRESSGKF